MCVFFPVGKAYIGFFVFKVFIFQEKSIFFHFFPKNFEIFFFSIYNGGQSCLTAETLANCAMCLLFPI
jgi:hypothetical protein